MAEFLYHRDRNITIVESADEIGNGIPLIKKIQLVPWLHQKGLRIITSATLEEVNDKGLVINTDGKKETIEADSHA